MTNGRHDLLDLLDLLAGKLPADQGGVLRQRLADDEPLRELWRVVSDAWHDTSDRGRTAGVSGRSAEQIGAFLDRRLDASECASMGDACRHDPLLVEEIVSAYRFRNPGSDSQSPPHRLTQRLLALGGPRPERSSTTVAGTELKSRLSGGERPCEAALQDRRPPRVSLRTPRGGRRASANSSARAPQAIIAVAVAAVVLGISLLAASHFAGSRGTDPKDVLTHDSAMPRTPANGRPTIDNDVRQSPVVPPRPTPDQPVVHNYTNTPPDSPDSPTAPPESMPDPTTTDSTHVVVDLTWDRIVGLVAMAGTRPDAWQGAHSRRVPETSITMASLPGSWATGRIAGTGEFVMDADTRVTLSASPRDEGRPQIEIDRGRFALRGLTTDTAFRIIDGNAETVVHIEEAGTVFVLDWSGGSRQVAVLAGRADLGDVSLRRRQFVAWTNGAWSPPQTIANPPAWLSNPETTVAIDPGDQQELLSSPDLLTALAALDQSASPQTRQTVVGWRLSLAPQATLLASLRSPNEPTRVATVGWLMEDPQSDPSHALAWQTFVQELNDPQLVRGIRRWMQLAAGGRPPARSDYGDLLAALDHAELGVRQIAATCLERITGRRAAAYRADGSPAERQAGIRQWRGIIVRSATGRGGANLPPTRTSRQASPRSASGR